MRNITEKAPQKHKAKCIDIRDFQSKYSPHFQLYQSNRCLPVAPCLCGVLTITLSKCGLSLATLQRISSVNYLLIRDF